MRDSIDLTEQDQRVGFGDIAAMCIDVFGEASKLMSAYGIMNEIPASANIPVEKPNIGPAKYMEEVNNYTGAVALFAWLNCKFNMLEIIDFFNNNWDDDDMLVLRNSYAKLSGSGTPSVSQLESYKNIVNSFRESLEDTVFIDQLNNLEGEVRDFKKLAIPDKYAITITAIYRDMKASRKAQQAKQQGGQEPKQDQVTQDKQCLKLLEASSISRIVDRKLTASNKTDNTRCLLTDCLVRWESSTNDRNMRVYDRAVGACPALGAYRSIAANQLAALKEGQGAPGKEGNARYDQQIAAMDIIFNAYFFMKITNIADVDSISKLSTILYQVFISPPGKVKKMVMITKDLESVQLNGITQFIGTNTDIHTAPWIMTWGRLQDIATVISIYPISNLMKGVQAACPRNILFLKQDSSFFECMSELKLIEQRDADQHKMNPLDQIRTSDHMMSQFLLRKTSAYQCSINLSGNIFK